MDLLNIPDYGTFDEDGEFVGTKPSNISEISELLDTLKSKYLEQLRQDNNTYILSYYDRESQVSIQAIYNDPDSNQTQKDHCKAIFDWIKLILGYYYQKKIAIRDTATNIAGVEAVTWDFSGNFDVLKPAHTLESIVEESEDN